jgi:hypothetical protein
MMTTAPKPRGRPKSKPAPVVPVEAPVPAFLAAIQAQAAAPEPDEVEVLNSVPDLRVTRSTFAAMLQVSLTTLQSYEAKNLIVKIDKRIDALASIRKIIGNLREVAGNRSSGSSEDGPNFKELKLEQEIRQLKLQNAKSEQELVDVESIHGVIRKALVSTADWLEGLPDLLEAQGVIDPAMAGRLIKVIDNKRESLLNMILSAVDEDDGIID